MAIMTDQTNIKKANIKRRTILLWLLTSTGWTLLYLLFAAYVWTLLLTENSDWAWK